ncbi:unnamed protein product [Pleuronectes platessa]|uniref:Uncharacterized protein n=1 Tax=Pleuronectes platessa TaxID=8262 RepID=A0A9N7USH2_PLEPL|nr:unnamed protein product [Pleuronectes platessa]
MFHRIGETGVCSDTEAPEELPESEAAGFTGRDEASCGYSSEPKGGLSEPGSLTGQNSITQSPIRTNDFKHRLRMSFTCGGLKFRGSCSEADEAIVLTFTHLDIIRTGDTPGVMSGDYPEFSAGLRAALQDLEELGRSVGVSAEAPSAPSAPRRVTFILLESSPRGTGSVLNQRVRPTGIISYLPRPLVSRQTSQWFHRYSISIQHPL